MGFSVHQLEKVVHYIDVESLWRDRATVAIAIVRVHCIQIPVVCQRVVRGVMAEEDDSWAETLAQHFHVIASVALTFQMEGGRRASRREKVLGSLERKSTENGQSEHH